MIEKLQLSQGKSVLDLGCGTGNVTKMVSERVGPEGRIIAVDPDKERLQIASLIENYSATLAALEHKTSPGIEGYQHNKP